MQHQIPFGDRFHQATSSYHLGNADFLQTTSGCQVVTGRSLGLGDLESRCLKGQFSKDPCECSHSLSSLFLLSPHFISGLLHNANIDSLWGFAVGLVALLVFLWMHLVVAEE